MIFGNGTKLTVSPGSLVLINHNFVHSLFVKSGSYWLMLANNNDLLTNTTLLQIFNIVLLKAVLFTSQNFKSSPFPRQYTSKVITSDY